MLCLVVLLALFRPLCLSLSTYIESDGKKSVQRYNKSAIVNRRAKIVSSLNFQPLSGMRIAVERKSF